MKFISCENGDCEVFLTWKIPQLWYMVITNDLCVFVTQTTHYLCICDCDGQDMIKACLRLVFCRWQQIFFRSLLVRVAACICAACCGGWFGDSCSCVWTTPRMALRVSDRAETCLWSGSVKLIGRAEAEGLPYSFGLVGWWSAHLYNLPVQII